MEKKIKKFLRLECKICGKENMIPTALSRHVQKCHNISYNDYKLKYNVETITKKVEAKTLLDNINPKDKTQCQICGFKSNKLGLGYHIKINHNINAEDYYNKYWGINKCKNCNEHIPKFRNIIEGRLDYCSKCLLDSSHPTQDLYWTLKKGAKTPAEVKEMKRNWRRNNHPQYKEYWLNRNYSVEEAENKFHEYRKTHNNVFNLNKRNNFSKISQELFIGIYEKLPECIRRQKIYFALLNNNKIRSYDSLKLHENYEYLMYLTAPERKILNKNGIAFDFFIKELNLIIEFDGTYWHNDPLYDKSSDDIIKNRIPDVDIYHVREEDFVKDYQKTATINYFVDIVIGKYEYYKGKIK